MVSPPLTHRPRRPRVTHRGQALLLVLGVLVLCVGLALPALECSAIVGRVRRDQAASLAIDDLAADVHTPIRRWLAERADRVVLPPDVSTPRVVVIDDTLVAEPIGTVRVRIVAYDQCGMVPWSFLRVDRALTLSLPRDVQDLDLSTTAPGLDLLFAAERPAFPSLDSSLLAVGELIATHNPSDRQPHSHAGINVNTAPEGLLRAAMTSAGRDALDRVIESRASGRPFAAMAGVPPPRDAAVTLVPRSDAWAFRIDLRVGHVARSWWSVYTLRGSQWIRSQNLAITR